MHPPKASKQGASRPAGTSLTCPGLPFLGRSPGLPLGWSSIARLDSALQALVNNDNDSSNNNPHMCAWPYHTPSRGHLRRQRDREAQREGTRPSPTTHWGQSRDSQGSRDPCSAHRAQDPASHRHHASFPRAGPGGSLIGCQAGRVGRQRQGA